jgi:hypothetical protein
LFAALDWDPPLQAPESYNLSGILEQVRKANMSHGSD